MLFVLGGGQEMVNLDFLHADKKASMQNFIVTAKE